MLYYRNGRKGVMKWDFNSADMDQGLMCHYFILTHGNGVLIDTETGISKLFHQGYLSTKDSIPEIEKASKTLTCCQGKFPTTYFYHFTGRSKPWMNLPSVDDITQYLIPYNNNNNNNNNLRVNNNLNPVLYKLQLNAKGQVSKPIRKEVLLWLINLDELQLPGINSTTIGTLGLSSPLGFFNVRFPKGGFVNSKKNKKNN